MSRPGRGQVLWSRSAPPGAPGSSGGAWLRLPEGVVGLAPLSAPLGPRWVCRPEPWPALAEGDPVIVDVDGLRTDDGVLFLDRRRAVGWLGPLPGAARAAGAPARAMISDVLLSSCRPSTLLDEPWHSKVEAALAAIGRMSPLDALKSMARAFGGLGPGLTPAGDDALSGILFAFRTMAGSTVEPALLAVARSVRTGELSAALLEAAAGGFHIEPVHDLVMAAAGGDASTAYGAAAELDRFGSSSGADISYGLRLAFTHR